MRLANKTLTVTSAGSVGEWIHLDHHLSTFNAQWEVTLTNDVSGNSEPTYTVEYTLDNVLQVGVSAIAHELQDATAASHQGSLTHAAAGLRVNVASVSGAGKSELRLRVLQTGN